MADRIYDVAIVGFGPAMMGADGGVQAAAATYIGIRILAAPVTLSNFTLLGFVLGRGMGSVGLALQILLNGVNIAMSILLGITFGFGIAGVAASCNTIRAPTWRASS